MHYESTGCRSDIGSRSVMSMKSRTEDILILYVILIERLHDREPSMRLHLHVSKTVCGNNTECSFFIASVAPMGLASPFVTITGPTSADISWSKYPKFYSTEHCQYYLFYLFSAPLPSIWYYVCRSSYSAKWKYHRVSAYSVWAWWRRNRYL